MQESQDREERERADARDKREQQLQKDRNNMEIHRRALRDKEYIEKKYALLEQEAAGQNDSRAGDFLEDRRNWLNTLCENHQTFKAHGESCEPID